MKEENLFKACNCLRALAHETRLAIIWMLRDGEKNVNDLAGALRLMLPNISQHLRILRDREIVVKRKQANQVFYRLRDPRILEIVKTLQTLHCEE